MYTVQYRYGSGTYDAETAIRHNMYGGIFIYAYAEHIWILRYS
jgi:hypothetical protein